MTDWSRYVGIPSRPHGRDRSGVDCWGLVRLIFKEERGIRLPDYLGRCPALDESQELARLITSERDAGPWREVNCAQPFDVLLFRVGAHETHVGLAVDARYMLHTFGAAGSVMERIDAPRWRKRLVGTYRYSETPAVQTPDAQAARECETQPNGAVQVVALPGPLPEQARRVFDVVSTATVEDIVRAALPGVTPEVYPHLRVLLIRGSDAAAVPQHMWAHVRPLPSTTVVVRVIPGAGAIAGFITGQLVSLLGVSSLLGAMGIYAGAYALATIGISALASAALNALIPVPDTPDGPGTPENAYGLQGWKNPARPGEPVPMPYGAVRVAPPFAMLPYQEIVGDDQYVRALFCFGYGRLDISDIRIGETPVEEYDDVTWQVREGLASDDPVSLTPIQVIEDPQRVELIYTWPKDAQGNDDKSGGREEQPVVRTTASNAIRASVIFSFPGGLFRVNDDGDTIGVAVSIRIRQRARGATTWTDVDTLVFSEKKKRGFFRQFSWALPSRGTWEIEIMRTSGSDPSSKITRACFLIALQSIRPEYPINTDAMTAPLALLSIKVKASYQLNGTLDNVNALVKRYAPDWDGAAWTIGQTRNPAALYAYALQGPDNPYPVPDDEIDWTRLAEWHYFCASKGLHYDRDHRASGGLIDRLRAICAAGRASPWHDGATWSVVIDSPSLSVSGATAGTVGSDPARVVAHICPRNSYGFSGSRSYLDTPDAVRVRFRNETDEYADDEVLIPWPGKSEPYDLVEQWDIVGKTNPDEIQREVYRLMQIAELRRDRWTVEQSDEFRVVTRGDAVRLSHYVLNDVQISGRVVAVDESLVVLDEAVTMAAGTTYVLQYILITEEDPVGSSVMTEVAAVDGTTHTLRVIGASVPPEGSLVLFGPADEAAFDALVLDIEPGQEFASTITLTNLAPEIDTLTDAFTPETWDPVVGQIVDLGLDPLAPVFAGIETTAAAGEYGTDARALQVRLAPATDEITYIGYYELDHRLQGSGSWTTVDVYTFASLSYDQGDVVEMQARAVDSEGGAGPATSVTTFTVGSDLAALAAPIDLETVTVTAGLGAAQITVVTSDANTASVQIFRTADGDSFDAETDALIAPEVESGLTFANGLPTTASQPITYVDGDSTRVDLLAAAWTAGGGWGSTALPSTHGTGSASTLSQSVSLTAGETYRGRVTISGRTAGSVTVQLAGTTDVPTSAITANGQTLFSLDAVTGNDAIEIVATSDFDGTVDAVTLYRETAACAPQGVHEYRFAALNSDGIGSAVSSEIEVTII